MSPKEKVLVIGDDTRSFLATVRSLGRHDIEVHVAPFNFLSPALSSRYISKIHFLPYYLDGGAAWLSSISTLLTTEKFNLVIPCDERGLLPLFKHKEQLEIFCKLALPNAESLDLFFDKLSTRRLASSLNIPIAKGRALLSSDTTQSIVDEVGLPLIVKFRKSYSWPDLHVRTSTQVLHTQAELTDWIHKNRSYSDDIFFEQLFSGNGVGISVLCSSGKILQAFEHHRVRELNGSSYYRKSAELHADRLAAVAKMVASANYTGIAMFEFKTNPKEGDWILLEINARPWGSLPLPVALGIDFPYRLYLLLVKDNETAPVAYKNEVYGRNLISDLWQVRTIMQVWSHTPRKLFLFLIQWFFEFRLLFLGREHHDVGVSDDRKPGILELRNFAGVFWESLRSKVFGEKPMKSGLRKKLIDIDRENTSASHILFICEGNICRSPYAEKKLQQLFTDEAQRYTILSAGMLPRNRRASPPVALEVAAQRGVSLTHHLSRHASEDLVKDAAIIILFDRTNLKSFLARYPSFENKVFFLGELRESVGKIVEIQDPFGKDAQTFNTTYEQIDECLNCFTEIIKKRPN